MNSNTQGRLFRGRNSKNGRRPVLLYIIILFLALLFLLPVTYVFIKAKEIGWQASLDLLLRPRMFHLFWNTIKLSFFVTLVSVLIGTTTALIVERTNVRGGKLLNALITLPFVVPAFVASYSWISVAPSLEGFKGALLVLSLSSYPLVHLPVVAALKGLDPALEETSRSLGRSKFTTFVRITLPQLKPAIVGGGILIALHMLAEFGALAFLNYETFTTAIFDQYDVAFNSSAAAMMTLVLLMLCLVIIFIQRLIIGNKSFTSRRSGRSSQQYKARLNIFGRGLAYLFIAILSILSVGVPVTTIIYWAIYGNSTYFDLDEIIHTLLSTLRLGLEGSVVTVIVALPIVYAVVRYRGWASKVANNLPFLIHSLPGLVIGLTLVFFAIRYLNPLYQTVTLLLIGYVILYLPLAQSSIRTSMEQIPPSLEEVGRSLGKRPITNFFKITLPLLTPGIGSGLALVFLEVMKELTSTLLLRPVGIDTLSTKIWEFTNELEYGASAPYALLLIVFSGLPVYLLTMKSFTDWKRVKTVEHEITSQTTK